MTNTQEGIRHCSRCRLDKPVSEFNRSSRTRHGRQQVCRECSREYYRLSVPATDRVIQVRFLALSPEQRRAIADLRRAHEQACANTGAPVEPLWRFVHDCMLAPATTLPDAFDVEHREPAFYQSYSQYASPRGDYY